MPLPPRPYPDWHRLVPERFREEVYRAPDDWTFYHNVCWESFLLYTVVLHHKDYEVEGGIPPWLEAYLDRREVVPFDCGGQDVVLTFTKDKWVKNTLTFHLADGITPGGMPFNMTSAITPSPEFLAGDPAPGRAACPQSVWEPYVVDHYERLRKGEEWSPNA